LIEPSGVPARAVCEILLPGATEHDFARHEERVVVVPRSAAIGIGGRADDAHVEIAIPGTCQERQLCAVGRNFDLHVDLRRGWRIPRRWIRSVACDSEM